MSSIEERMAQLEGRVATLEGTVAALRAAQAAGAGPGASSGGAPRVASDADLDGQHGDPVVKFDPRDWKGRSYVGLPYSRTEADYLDLVAAAKEWSADREEAKPEKRKYARYSRADAARARGWAARIRAGKVKKPPLAPPPPADPWGTGRGAGGDDEKDDGIPF